MVRLSHASPPNSERRKEERTDLSIAAATRCQQPVRLDPSDDVQQLGAVQDLTSKRTVSGVVGKVHRVDWAHVAAVQLQRKGRAFIARIPTDDVGLDGNDLPLERRSRVSARRAHFA